MTIARKLFLAMFSVGLFVALAAGGFFYFYTKNILYNNELNSRINDVKKMSVTVADSMEMNDYVPIVNYLGKMKSQDAALMDIAIIDARGEIVASTDPLRIGSRYKGAPRETGVLSWEMGIHSVLKGSALGRVSVRYDEGMIRSFSSDALGVAARKIVFYTAVALLVGCIPGILLALSISKPLKKLAAECRKVSDGNLALDLAPQGNDEVSAVTREVKSMVDKLGEVDRMKDDFVNNVSHELRSPLASIKSYVEIMQSGAFGPLTAKQLEFIEMIKKASVRLTTFINNVLDVAKIKAGKFELDCQESNLHDLLSDTLKMYQPLFIEKGIECTVQSEREASCLFCDSENIKRVMINLVSNALKFTQEKGSIVITMGIEGAMMRFSIKDSGHGISAEELPKLFGRFEQARDDKTRSVRKKGTGLGLSISRDIVELHGGRIWAESPGEGLGTTFLFLIPRSHQQGAS